MSCRNSRNHVEFTRDAILRKKNPICQMFCGAKRKKKHFGCQTVQVSVHFHTKHCALVIARVVLCITLSILRRRFFSPSKVELVKVLQNLSSDYCRIAIGAAIMTAENSVDADDLKVNLLTQEIKFAKMLAGNEFNGAIKEKHIKKLSTWLKNRSACSQGTFACSLYSSIGEFQQTWNL